VSRTREWEPCCCPAQFATPAVSSGNYSAEIPSSEKGLWQHGYVGGFFPLPCKFCLLASATLCPHTKVHCFSFSFSFLGWHFDSALIKPLWKQHDSFGMSCAGTSFVRRHLYFRMTTSLLTVLPQLAHLALLQASISLGFFLPAWTLVLYKHPDQMSQGSLRAERQLLLLLCFSACLMCLLLLSPSSPLPRNYWPSGDAMPQDFSGLFFLSPEKSLSRPYWISQCSAVTYQYLGQSTQEESNCGHKGQHPAMSKEGGWRYCSTRVLSYCPLCLKFCKSFKQV